ncbi:hypothetical protein V6N13_084574 [Hibiscus sabdariffa]
MDLHHLDSIIGNAHGLYPSFGPHLFVKSVEYMQIHQPYLSGDFVHKLLSYKTPDFDRAYGHGWQCVVGTDFSSFVTHNHGCFMHFCVGSLAILLFRGAVNQAREANLFPKFEALDA